MTLEVEIVEVAPRDGLQSEPGILPTQFKVELIRRLIDAGVRRMEVASFVSPARVPQMADAEQVLAALPRDNGVTYIGLVLNRRGLQRAIEAGCAEVGMAVVASDTFNRRNQGVSTRESIADWLAMAPLARAAGLSAQVTVSAAFGCPFEGDVPIARVVEIAQRVAEAQPREIAIADTIGAGVPAQVTELIGRLRMALPDMPLRCHFHDTRNTAVANVWAAFAAGVRIFDASVAGAGGCPFAPGATGNVATEDLLYMLERSGIHTGVALQGTIDTARWLAQYLRGGAASRLAKAGAFAPVGANEYLRVNQSG